METAERVRKFLASACFGVAGASRQRHKFGNKVLRCYLRNSLPVIPVHPLEAEIEGIACVATVADLPDEARSLSIITPPAVTEQIVEAAFARGIENIWMQPGAESEQAVRFCRERGINLIYGGPCLLVELGFFDR